MELHPLTNEKTFTAFLGTLSCRYCIFLKDEKCTHENAEENEASKDWIREDDKKRGYDKDANDYFVCKYYESELYKNRHNKS